MADKEEFIYLYDLSQYNILDFISENEEIILKHWGFLQQLKSDGYLLLSGITLDSTYEFVVVQTKDRDVANELFKADPYSDLGLIHGKLYSFRASLLTVEKPAEMILEDDFSLDSFYVNTNSLFMGTIKGRPTFVNDMTEEEGKIMGIHFQHLKKNFDEGKLIFAGSILEEGMFGISVFYADNLEDARIFVKNDLAVVNRILEPNVHPFKLLLIGKR
jgi:uncharacterized protein YciI